MLKIDSLEEYKSDQILNFEDAVKLVCKLKSQGKTVGLCHGGFDILHPGHVKHFESAKKLCDVLLISITSDRFVACRKGSGRPVFTDKARAYMAASVEFVDYVIVTDFKLGVDVIKSLKPSFYIKGPDFINKTTPGITAEREAIKSVSGEMRYTNDPKLSTTEIISYIKNELDVKRLLIILDRDGTLIKNNDFFGRNKDWIRELEFNKDVTSFLLYLQTKYKTTLIVVTNQAGVAKRYFSCKTIEEINEHIQKRLEADGIKIKNWQYCPYCDSAYALKNPQLNLNPKYVQEKTKRKPAPDMVFDALKEIGNKIDDFSDILVIGNSKEDAGLAENLKARYIDINGKNYNELVVGVGDI